MMDEKKQKRVKITGKTLTGETRTYEFEKIPAIVGVRLIHEYGSVMLSNMESIKNAFAAFHEDNQVGTPMLRLLGLVDLVPKIITWPRLQELSRDLLAGGSVNGEVLDKDGMCDLFGGDPFELYAAIFWALTVNYPKYLSPLLEALDTEGEGDTTHASDVT
jgi:hypothetical protein